MTARDDFDFLLAMILLLIGVAVAAAWLTFGTPLFIPAVVVAIASFWSNGVMANFRGDPQTAPDWAAAVSIISTVAAIGLIASRYAFF